jgi:ubiquinone/menaquinone biosynthesis C-methylase UbiE
MTDTLHQERLKSAYSDPKVSDSYIQDRFDSGIGRILHEAQVKFVIDAILRFKINKVLEIAPGPARLTVDIGSACKETCGTILDVNVNMLEQAQKRLSAAGLNNRWRTVVGDAFALPFDDIFQMVYSFRFIRHFHKEDRMKIYRQIYNHLETQGYLIFDAINHDVSAPLRAKSSPDAYPIYDELYHFPQLKAELENNRFKIIDHVAVQYSFPLLNLIQIWIGPRSKKLAYMLMKNIETAGIGHPLEWIVICQKM